MSTICYELDKKSKLELMDKFPPKYPAVRYDHITVELGDMYAKPPKPVQSIYVIGLADDNNGMQAFVVAVDGSVIRPTDGRIWHITASFDPDKKAPAEFDIKAEPDKQTSKPYRAVTSNGLLCHLFDKKGKLKKTTNPNWQITLFEKPIPVLAHPKVQYKVFELEKLKDLGRNK